MYSQHCTTRKTVPSIATIDIITVDITGVFMCTAWMDAIDTTPLASKRLVLSSVKVLAYIVVHSLVPTLVDTDTMLLVLPVDYTIGCTLPLVLMMVLYIVTPQDGYHTHRCYACCYTIHSM